MLRMEMKKVIIVGAGGFGREVLDVIEAINESKPTWDFLGFVDDNPELQGSECRGYKVLGGVESIRKLTGEAIVAIVAVGNNSVRKSIVRRIEQHGGGFCTLIHPAARVTRYVKIGKGVIITAGCVLTTNIKIANHVIVNIGCTVGHDVILEDYVNLNPGVHINGSNVIGEGAYVGTGAVTIQDISIGRWSVVGAGAVVIRDIPERTLAVGVPAKPVKELNEFVI
jgi:sugar O-acyltransferase (sialic acid O-acetyltransferase NeuD family)